MKYLLILTWSENCLTTSKATRHTRKKNNPKAINAACKMTDTQLYVPVVTLSTEDVNKLLEQLKTRFKRAIRWNKYRSIQMTNQLKTNNLNYSIDPRFKKFNGLFVLSFEKEDDTTNCSKYFKPKVEIKDFNVLIDGESFFDVPIKSNKKQKRTKRLLK